MSERFMENDRADQPLERSAGQCTSRLDMDRWLEEFRRRLTDLFGERLRFFGIQGSYGRGEQTEGSDIDVVVITDRMRPEDLLAYRRMLEAVEHNESVCGFVAGEEELRGWEKADLLQLYLDTKPLYGSLEEIWTIFTEEDVRRAVLAGACNLYHASSHNFLHARDLDVLKGLYKAARFTVRMKYRMETGEYIASMARLEGLVSSGDMLILETARLLDGMNDIPGISGQQVDISAMDKNGVVNGYAASDFDRYSLALNSWAAGIIRNMPVGCGL